ncbi:MAG: hypothetical protein ACRDY4_09475, partial [Acidimicrobiia bacterium]
PGGGRGCRGALLDQVVDREQGFEVGQREPRPGVVRTRPRRRGLDGTRVATRALIGPVRRLPRRRTRAVLGDRVRPPEGSSSKPVRDRVAWPAGVPER